jgi:hypothetical protein
LIIVRPREGLANRLRVLNSALILAKKNNVKKIHVLWIQSEELNASFQDLFLINDSIIIINKSFLYDLFFKKEVKNRFNLYVKIGLKKLFSFYKVYDNNKIYLNRFNNIFWKCKQKNVIIDTCYDFFKIEDGNFYKVFQLVPELNRIVTSISSSFIKNIYGLHIRQTDNLKAIEISSKEMFMKFIEYKLSYDNEIKFYLATDDKILFSILKNKYPNNIIFQVRHNFNRNTKFGVIESAIDMFVLSKFSVIYGSYWSSFSEVSSWIDNKSLVIINQEYLNRYLKS